MLTKNRIKQLQSLRDSKERQLQGRFLVEGPKWVQEVIDSSLFTEEVYGTADWMINNAEGLKAKDIPATLVNIEELRKISSQINPNAVLAVVRIPEAKPDADGFLNGLTLVLDGIQDPGNLGTIIRIADWFGIHQLICSPDCVDVYNPKVVQASMGSVIRVGVFYQDLPAFLAELPKELNVYGAVLDGNNIIKETLTQQGIIIIGNESKGISPAVMPFVNKRILIPSFSSTTSDGGKAESLNASVATALICYEFRRSLQ